MFSMAFFMGLAKGVFLKREPKGLLGKLIELLGECI
jgi:hypothetical protein